MKEINFQDFLDVELRTWTIIKVEDYLEAKKPAYKLEIDFGEEIGIKKSSSQLTHLYGKNELLGKQIIWVVNFPSKQIGKFISECLVTWFIQENWAVILAVPDKEVKNGTKLL